MTLVATCLAAAFLDGPIARLIRMPPIVSTSRAAWSHRRRRAAEARG